MVVRLQRGASEVGWVERSATHQFCPRAPRRLGSVLTLGSLLLAFASLGGCGAPAGDGAAPTGEVVVDGSSTVFRISRAAMEQYARVQPSARVVVENHGTGGGFGRYREGEVDLVDASRAAKPEEESRAKAQGIDWTRFLVGYDGITVVVNSKNDFVKSLSVAQLKALWERGSKVNTWKDLDPSWPARKIQFYSPDPDSGTFEFFVDAIIGKQTGQREDVQTSSDDNTLVSGVAGDADGIGYFGYAYYAANAQKLRALSIQADAAAAPVAPGPETILDKSYKPLSRPLFVYAKKSSLRRPEVAGFMRYYLDHAGALAEKAGYVAPTTSDLTANQAAWPPEGAAPTKNALPASEAPPAASKP
jgi:phosphate transport system substrate-binding protein